MKKKLLKEPAVLASPGLHETIISLLKTIIDGKKLKILDAGAGEGTLSLTLKNLGYNDLNHFQERFYAKGAKSFWKGFKFYI